MASPSLCHLYCELSRNICVLPEGLLTLSSRLILEFRVWLDAARLLLLLVLQIGACFRVLGDTDLYLRLLAGAATVFTYFNPKILCPSQSMR